LLLAMLPASATIIAALVLAQIPSLKDIAGIALVIAGVAVHQPAAARSVATRRSSPS
jgi:inner membrane transporter RhtA